MSDAAQTDKPNIWENPSPSLTHTIARYVGVVSSGGAAVLWVLVMWLPSAREVLGSWSPMVVGVILMFLAIIGALAALRGHANAMLGLFLAAFLPVGGVLIWANHWMRWIGVLNLLYLVAGMIVRWTAAPRERESE